jgi:hypothetical protein
VGGGRKDEDGKVTPPNVKAGQTVMYSKYSGTEFEVRLVMLGRRQAGGRCWLLVSKGGGGKQVGWQFHLGQAHWPMCMG